MKLAAAAALFTGVATAKDLTLTWKDCGGPNTKTKITGFSPTTITLGQKTTVTGKGDLSESVDAATFDLTMTGAIGQLLHCTGDASVTKTCALPLGTGKLTFEGMKFPIAAGNVPVNVDLDLSAALPGALTKTKTITKATAKNGDDLFCLEIDSSQDSEDVSSDGLKNWESHGEVVADSPGGAELLSRPALDDKMIEEINSQNGATWVAGRNPRFEGATLQDVKKLLGTLQNTDPTKNLPYKAPEKILDLPAEFDWRTDPRAANCPSLKEIRDQSNCGSCWAFGSVEAMTDRRCIASGGKDQTHLSAQDVTSCDHLGDMGCNGGIPSTVYTYYRSSGIVDGGNYGDKSMCYSYQMEPCAHHSASTKYKNCTGALPTPKCASKCIDDGKPWGGSKHHGKAGYSVCPQSNASNSACVDHMMQDIYQNGPITGMFFVHQSFESYKSGVYKAGNPITDPMLGGHAIKIMGWGTENGAPYWLVANSWNEDWGDHGYFKIDKGHNQCQIENAMINGGPVAGLPATNMEVVV